MLKSDALRLTLVGVGAMNSPRYAPAGLFVEYGKARVVIDGWIWRVAEAETVQLVSH